MDRLLLDSTGPEITDVLSEIASALVGRFDPSKLLDQVVNTTMRTFHAEDCSIFLEDRELEPGFVTMRAGSGLAAPLVGRAKYPIGEGFIGFIAKHGKALNIRSRQELESLEVDGIGVWQSKYDRLQWSSGKSEFRNCIALALRINGQILGVIKLENKDAKFDPHFTDDDLRHLGTIANVVALALENARLHQRIERQLKSASLRAAHRIHNQATNYDGIDLDLLDECRSAIPDKQKLWDILHRIRDTTTGLKRMIEEFKGYGKPLQLERRYSDIGQIIRDEAWYAKPPPNIRIDTDLDPSVPQVYIDAPRFAEALKEVLRNSLKAMQNHPSGRQGHVTISTRPAELPGSADPSPQTRRRAAVRIRIEDAGPGFPPGFPVFEPFQSTDPKSSGMGLATVKELIDAHNGTVFASLRPGGGALIELTIPVGPD